MSGLKFFSASNIRVSLGLGFVKVIKAIMSLLTVMLSAKYFGTTLERDAWIIGGSVITVIIQVFFGPINETFRTKYIHLREEQSAKHVNLATDSLISLILFVGIVFSLLAIVFPSLLSSIFAPGFSPEQNNVLILMIKILIPSLIIIEITDIWSAILNAYSSFYLPDLFSFITISINILFILILAPSIGIYSLIISSYISSILLILAVYRELHFKFNYRFRIVIPKWRLVQPFLIFAFPFYVNYIFSQTDVVIEKALTTMMITGSVSVLDYARKFSDLPVNTIVSVVTTVLTPILALGFLKSPISEIVVIIRKYFRIVSFVLIPISTLFIIAPTEIVELVLSRGAFKLEYVPVTANLLRLYGLGIFITSNYIVFAQVLITQKKVRLFSYIVIITYILKIIFNLSMFNRLNLYTFPISWIFSQLIISCLMIYFGIKEYRKTIIIEVIKVYLLLLLTLIISFIFFSQINGFFDGTMQKGLLLILTGCFILVIEVVFVVIFRFDERIFVINILSGKNKSS